VCDAVIKRRCRRTWLIPIHKHKHSTGRGGKVGVVRERGRTADSIGEYPTPNYRVIKEKLPPPNQVGN